MSSPSIPRDWIERKANHLLSIGRHNEADAIRTMLGEYDAMKRREAQSFAETIERKVNEKRLEALQQAEAKKASPSTAKQPLKAGDIL